MAMVRDSTGRPQATTNSAFWADLDQPPPYQAGGGFDERGTPPSTDTGFKVDGGSPSGGPPTLNTRDPASVNAFREYYGNMPGADPSLLSDPNYWNQKVMSGELGNDPSYIGQKMQTAWTGSGQGGMGGGLSNYAPLAPFQYGGNFSSFSAPSVGAPDPFKYTGPNVSMPNQFGFPGVYQQQAPEAPQAQQAQAPATNPYGVEENGMVRLSNGALVPKDHPLAADFNNWQAPTQPVSGPAITKGENSGGPSAGASTPERRGMPVSGPASQEVVAPDGTVNASGVQIAPFQGAPNYQAPTPFSFGQGVPSFNQYQTGQPFGSFGNDPTITAPDAFTPGTFAAPTADDMSQDPGYQFRVQQALDTLQQSAAARGTLFTSGTEQALMAQAQQMASQEYGNVYARRFGEFQQSEAERANAAAFNAGTSMNAQQGTFNNALSGYGANQQTAYQNEAQRLAAAQYNTSAGLAQQQQAYGQASNTYGLNAQTQQSAAELAQNNARANYALDTGTRLGAQNQAFNQSLAQNQANTANSLSAQQQAWTQQYQPWAQNASNNLQAGTASAQLAAQTNALNASQEQNQYQAAWNAYQSQVQQNQFGAGNALNWANYGLGAQNQAFNQNQSSYLTNYQTQVVDPWNREFQMAQLGSGAANGANSAAGQYGSNAGNLITGNGNSQAAGQVGAANAWSNTYANLANLGISGLGQYYAYRPNNTGGRTT